MVEKEMIDYLEHGIKNLLNQKEKKSMSRSEKNQLEIYKEGLANALTNKAFKPYALPEKDKPSKAKIFQSSNEKSKVEKQRNIKNNSKKHKEKEIKIPKNKICIKGKQYKYNFNWYDGGIDGPIYERNFSEKNKELEIWINKDFPMVDVIKDKAFYIFNQIADAIAKTMVEKSNQEGAHHFIKETILRETARYVKKIKEN